MDMKDIPSIIQGDGRKFVSTLKDYLKKMELAIALKTDVDLMTKTIETIKEMLGNKVENAKYVDDLTEVQKEMAKRVKTEIYTKELTDVHLQIDGKVDLGNFKDAVQDMDIRITDANGKLDKLKNKTEIIEKVLNPSKDDFTTFDEQVRNIRTEEQTMDGKTTVIVSWNPYTVKNYNGAIIDVRNVDSAIDNIPSNAPWTRHYVVHNDKQFYLEDCKQGAKYQIRIRATNVFGERSSLDGIPIVEHIVTPHIEVVEPPYDFSIDYGREDIVWTWKQRDGAEYLWTELRLDTERGKAKNMLDRTNALSSTVKPPYRNGKAYLYNIGKGNVYSDPVSIEYTKPYQDAPRHVTLDATYQGLIIRFDAIPTHCIGANIYINDEKHFVRENYFNYLVVTGNYTVRVCYVDMFGEGEKSPPQSISTHKQIPSNAVHITSETVFDSGIIVADYIGKNQIVGTHIKEGSITTGHLAANSITSAKIDANAITSDKIEAGAIKTEHMKVNSIEGDRIKANSIEAKQIKAGTITGEQIAAGAITTNNLKSNSITADKLAVGAVKAENLDAGAIKADTLSAISSTIGLLRTAKEGARVEISDNLIQVFDEEGKLRVRMGVWK